MSRVLVRLRAVAVWSLLTTVAGPATALAAHELRAARAVLGTPGATAVLDGSFDQVLTWSAALALVVSVGWGWLAGTAVLVRVLVAPADLGPDAGRAATPLPGVPRGLQRLLLAACGLAVAGGLAVPAQAAPGVPPGPAPEGHASLSGLPLPERAHAPEVADGAAARPAARLSTTVAPWPEVVVRPGDSLWAIAAARLPPDASDADITRAWQHLHAVNRAVVGADPDLIHPAQRLRLPGR